MNYVKADAVLPPELIEEIQKYVQGETIYIPKLRTSYQKWGTKSGTRKLLADRNHSIKESFRNGMSIGQLAETYHLSIETIKKIVYAR